MRQAPDTFRPTIPLAEDTSRGCWQARAYLRMNLRALLWGKALAPLPISYSERGQAYVNDVLGMIRYNKLDATDHTYLMDMKPIKLVPVGEGVK